LPFMGKFIKTLAVSVLLAVVLLCVLFSFYDFAEQEKITGKIIARTTRTGLENLGIEDDFNTEEFHWPHLPVTFNYENCSRWQIKRIEKALEYIENRTEVLSFKRADSKEDILFVCSKERKNNGSTLAESLPSIYIGTKLYAPSTIMIYPSYYCINQRPIVEIHEVMHLFGLEHAPANDSKNIMNPYVTRCDAELSQQDIKKIREIYSRQIVTISKSKKEMQKI